MIMKVRLEVLKNKKPEQYCISKKYYEFLKKRTKLNNKDRYNIAFKY
jgi:PHD/YefM family antitoxin component YafN of YafNO toxin-antitoxin module